MMKPINTARFVFLSRSVNESFARGALAAFLAQADPTVPQLADIKTAVSEAVRKRTLFPQAVETTTLNLRLLSKTSSAKSSFPIRLSARLKTVRVHS